MGRTFTPTLFPLVDVVTERDINTGREKTVGYVTSAWRRYQEGVALAVTPGAAGEVYASNGAAAVWQLIVNANIGAGANIAYSKLNLAGSIVNADIDSAAAIAYSKLALTGSIVNADISGAAAIAISKIAQLAGSTYTPTLTNVANITASTAYQCQYLRVGTTVTVGGKVDIDPTAGATLTQLGISLPIASNFGANEDCGGAAAAPVVAGYSAAILGDAANNRAELQFTTGADVANRSWWFTFTYEII